MIIIISYLQMSAKVASLYGREILMIFLRKDYQYKLSSNACEGSLPLRHWDSHDFPQETVPIQVFFTYQ
jgi:hypothetical protein